MVSPLVLRETDQRRLLFQPELIDNPRKPEDCLRGTFFYQRKWKNGAWENHLQLPLNRLRAQEWIKLELHSSEVTELFSSLAELYQLYRQRGVPFGEVDFVAANRDLSALLAATSEELDTLLGRDADVTHEILARFLHWASRAEDLRGLAELLRALEPEGLTHLSAAAGLASLKQATATWKENQDNSDEGFWQQQLSRHSWVLSQVFSRPIVVIQPRAYMGGKTILDTGGNLLDFLGRNTVTGNAALVEIKTPTTELLGELYRGDIFNVSRELSGSVQQIANYKHQLVQNCRSLQDDEIPDLDAFEPLAVVIIGNAQRELRGQRRKKSFELFRHHLREVEIVTFDEMFTKVEQLVALLEGADQTPPR